MKILQVNKFFYLKGGSEKYFFDVSQALADAGHEVIHFSMHDERNQPSPYADYFIRPIDFTNGKTLKKAGHYVYSLEAAEHIKRLVQATKPDVAHLHNIAHQLTPSIIVTLRQLGVPVVQTLHDYQLICPNYKLFTQGAACERCHVHKYWNAVAYRCVQDSRAASALSALEMGFHNVLLKTYAWGVDQFIAPSHFLYDKLLQWGWKKSQVTYLPHFVPDMPGSSTSTTPATPKKRQVLFVGRLSQEKGADFLLQVAQQVTDVEFIFAGAGPEADRLKKIAAEQGVSHCTFVGFQHADAVQRLMRQSLAVVVPSLWYENAPLVVYEALALGTPVLASGHGGLVELIQEGQNGYLFEPGNVQDAIYKLQQVLHNKPLQLGPNPYTTQAHLAQLLPLYQRVRHE